MCTHTKKQGGYDASCCWRTVSLGRGGKSRGVHTRTGRTRVSRSRNWSWNCRPPRIWLLLARHALSVRLRFAALFAAVISSKCGPVTVTVVSC